MRVSLKPSMIQRLEELRPTSGRDAVEQEHDAFMLFGGMGTCLYIRRDGTLLVGADEFWGEPETRVASQDEACKALVIGARRYEMPGLLDLLPPRPDQAVECSHCRGLRWASFRTVDGGCAEIVCPTCSGSDWAAN